MEAEKPPPSTTASSSTTLPPPHSQPTTATTTDSTCEPFSSSSSVLADLSSLRFRFPSSRDAVPTEFLHFSATSNTSTHRSVSPLPTHPPLPPVTLSPTTMHTVFSRYGRVVGLLLPPPHRSGYVQFEGRQQAARALNALHHQLLPEVGGKLLVHFSCVKSTPSAPSTTSTASPPIPPSTSSSPSSLLSSLRLYSPCLTVADAAALNEWLMALHKGDFVYGKALPEEDDRFGLPAPKPLPPPLSSLNLPLRPHTPPLPSPEPSDPTEGKGWVHPSSSPLDGLPTFDFNRVALHVLHPGNGLRATSHDSAHSDPSLALLCSHGHTVVSLTSRHAGDTSPIDVFVPANSLLYLPSTVTSAFQYSIPYRTRDQVGRRKVKRDKAFILLFSSVHERADTAPAPSISPPAHVSSRHPNVAMALPARLSSLPPHLLESQHVHAVYETIATHFSHTRHSPWPRVESYLTSLPPQTRLADVGCGNGKYFSVNPSLQMKGCDLSQGLVNIARGKGYDVEVMDCQLLQWPSSSFDVVISVALLHHLSVEERRLQALREMLRVVRVGGEVLVTAWAQEQDKGSRRRFEQQDVLVPWTLPSHFQEGEKKMLRERGKQGEAKDGEEEAKEEERRQASELIVHRYCHVYVEGEIEGLLTQLGQNRVVDRYYDRGNWVVLVQKTSEGEPDPPRIARGQKIDT